MIQDALVQILDADAPKLSRMLRSRYHLDDAAVDDTLAGVRLRLLTCQSAPPRPAWRRFVWRSTLNFAIDVVRKERLHRRVACIPESIANDGGISQLEDRIWLAGLIAKLPKIYQAPVLYFASGWDSRAAAAALGLSVPAYKCRLYRGRHILAQMAGHQ